MTIEEAIDRLLQNGLDPTFWGGEEQRIIGILKFENAITGSDTVSRYSIYHWEGHWIAVIPEPFPRMTLIKRSSQLHEVVEAICHFYSLRQDTEDDGTVSNAAVKLLAENGLMADLHGISKATIWGKTQPHATKELHVQKFGIFPHAGAWLAVYIKPEGNCQLIKYSRALGEVVQAVLDFFNTEA